MELEERLREGAASVDDWQVYRDQLLERGDPYGELVALGMSLELARTPELVRRFVDLQRTLDPALFGPAFDRPELFDLEHSNGFLNRVQVIEPWERSPEPLSDWLTLLFRSRHAPFMRTLELDREQRDDVSMGALGERGLFEWAAQAFSEVKLPQVRTLRVGRDPGERMRLSESSHFMITDGAPGTPGARICRPDLFIGDLSRPLDALSRLEVLRLCGECISFSKLPTTLRALTLETRFLRQSVVKTVARAALPKLESLELWLGQWPDSMREFQGPEPEAFYGPPTGAFDLEPMFGAQFPSLRRLALKHCAWGGDLVRALTESATAKGSLVSRIESLDLSWSFLDDAAVASLLERRSAFVHLKHLDLSHTRLSNQMRARLAEAFGSALVTG